MKTFLIFRLALCLLVALPAAAQSRKYTVLNASPEQGVLRCAYTVSLTLMIENSDGMRISLYSDAITIDAGKQHTFSITPPHGFTVVSGSEAFKVQTGSCDLMVFTADPMTVRGNAASCQGIYNVTLWKPVGNDSYALRADLLHGAARQD